MARIAFRLVRKPRKTGPAQYQEVREQVRIGLEPVANDIIRRYLNPIVSNWRNRPIFIFKPRVGPKRIELRIGISNVDQILHPLYGGTIGDLWQWINKGVGDHDITPRYAPALTYQDGPYIPKTNVGPSYGGPGTRTGPWKRVHAVEHPGFTGRDFVGVIGKQVRLRFDRAVDAAYKRGLRRAGIRR